MSDFELEEECLAIAEARRTVIIEDKECGHAECCADDYCKNGN